MTTDNQQAGIFPQQIGDPPDLQESLDDLQKSGKGDNEVTLGDPEVGSVLATSTPKKDQILRDLRIQIPAPATKIPRINRELLPNKRPLVSSDLKFEIPKKLKLKGEDALWINKLEEQANQLKETENYKESFLIDAVKLQCENPSLLKMTLDGCFILSLKQLFATMRAHNNVALGDPQAVIENRLAAIQQQNYEPYREYHARMLCAFSETLEAQGRAPQEIERQVKKNCAYLNKMLFRGILVAGAGIWILRSLRI